MGVFYLKLNDTLPLLEVALTDPDGGAHDLDSETIKLRIWNTDGTKLVRDMVIEGAAALGVVRYQWVAADWAAGSGGPPFTAGGLIVGPALPVKPSTREARMEYEVTSGSDVLTFPNADYDTLRIWQDIN